MRNIVMKIEGIEKSFPGTKALDGVSMDLYEGEVHALVGENGAGKSTLMNIISGVLKADSGKISFNGKEARFDTPKQAQDAGVAFVHQELAICPEVSVAENIFMGRGLLLGRGIIDYKTLYEQTKKIIEPFQHNISPKEKARNLNIAEQQVVEIARALSQKCNVLILDEPTSSLTEAETKILFDIIGELKRKGISIIYISHKMEEIFRICDRLTVLRDGKYINTLNVGDVTEKEILHMMVGREIEDLYPPKGCVQDEIIFEVKNFNRKNVYENINFNLKKGEILGLVGLIGAGRTEVACGICGIDKTDSGEVYIEGKKLKISNYQNAIDNGLVYMTEDRKKQGLFLDFSTRKNLTCTRLDKVPNKRFINNKKEMQIANQFIEKMRIKTASGEQKVSNLSGGNQQKVMLSKWLFADPKVMILDEPTRGIDVGEKTQIHKMLRKFANEGIGIIIISSELPEIIGMSDRALVMHQGKIKGELFHEEICEKKIITIASGMEKEI